ncbi:myristoylated alanine-rich C-kinase substrate-like [Oxyura jamaicensis]|uniref:myristoylated alanine-rich C-kinase substrate-like n=1 Tax=Oxyura jamaicensis TaxID=8884 RepID=UPI0015A5C88C|nr:myristoylated alanine-rich C-kinase substrate-like [Oxyura jamaicensis]
MSAPPGAARGAPAVPAGPRGVRDLGSEAARPAAGVRGGRREQRGGAESAGGMGGAGGDPARAAGEVRARAPHLLQRGAAALPDRRPVRLQEEDPGDSAQAGPGRSASLPLRPPAAPAAAAGRAGPGSRHGSLWPG